MTQTRDVQRRAIPDNGDKVRLQELLNQSLFEGIELGGLVGLLELCQKRKVVPGEVIIAEGEASRECYLILSGVLRVHLGDTESSEISVLRAGESVGEISILDGKEASAHVVADVESELLVLPEDIFWSLINASHAFAQKLLYLLASRMRESNVALTNSIRRQQEYKRNSTVDELTGLHNRRWMHEMVDRQIKRCQYNDEPMSLLMIDIDHFKSVNDNFGHLAGDEVLRRVALTLMANLRPTDLLARFGGEEFVAVLPDTGLKGASVAAETMRKAVLQDRDPESSIPATTVSIGVTTMRPGQSFEQMVEAADKAMYLAKNSGRNRVTLDPHIAE